MSVLLVIWGTDINVPSSVKTLKVATPVSARVVTDYLLMKGPVNARPPQKTTTTPQFLTTILHPLLS